MDFEKVFVTVGTTQFDDLIATTLSAPSLQQLKSLKCRHLLIQYGTGSDVDAAAIESAGQRYGITVECYRLRKNISEDIVSSDLVISHAGAGSCIEVLTARKPLIVVINEKLMDNHQTELASQLHADGHLLYCTPTTLAKTLERFGGGVQLQPYEPGNMTKLVTHLDSLMDFWSIAIEHKLISKNKQMSTATRNKNTFATWVNSVSPFHRCQSQSDLSSFENREVLHPQAEFKPEENSFVTLRSDWR